MTSISISKAGYLWYEIKIDKTKDKTSITTTPIIFPLFYKLWRKIKGIKNDRKN